MRCKLLRQLVLVLVLLTVQLVLVLQLAGISKAQVTKVQQVAGSFGVEQRGNASSRKNWQFEFTFTERVNSTQAVRLHANSTAAGRNYPILFVVRQQRSILSFQIPEIQEGSLLYSQVGRTLCPVQHKAKGDRDKNQTIYVDVYSASSQEMEFSLNVTLISGFELQINREYTQTITPSQPQYFKVTFPPHALQLAIIVESQDASCMIVSAQSLECPVYDLVRNVEFSGEYQTMSTKAQITMERSSIKDDSFYIVFVLKPARRHCSFKRLRNLQPSIRERIRNKLRLRVNASAAAALSALSADPEQTNKTFSFKVTGSLPAERYYLPVFGVILFFIGFHLVAGAIIFIYQRAGASHYEGRSCFSSCYTSDRLSDIEISKQAPERYGSSADSHKLKSDQHSSFHEKEVEVEEEETEEEEDRSTEESTHSEQMLLDEGGGECDDSKPRQQFVVDLCRKRPLVLNRKYALYYWYLIIISIFYGLPVVQLVITYQQILRISGNQDICYYNFYCAHPLGVISAFNNVFSNIGYIMLGLLFLGLTRRRSLLYERHCQLHGNQESLGVPQHFGIFYAMGGALIMEGIMSACYHVCPSYSNFQFDTAYMYVLAVLSMLKIYQTRHPDINATAHVGYMAIAIVIFVSVVGVVYGTSIFWVGITVILILGSLFLTGEVYYMGHWKVNVGLVRRFYLMMSRQGVHCLRPMYKDRMVILVTANVINWTTAIYGAISRPQDVNSFLLYIFLVNLLMYIAFYVVMKLRSGERIELLPLVFVIFSCISWAFGIWFLMQRPSNWALSPAESRGHNQRCWLLHFYDTHDIWHFLSAMSMFFSFMAMLTLDDDLVNTPRHMIPVF